MIYPYRNNIIAQRNSLQSVAVSDFNHDSRLDIAVANTGGETVSVLLGNGDGSLAN